MNFPPTLIRQNSGLKSVPINESGTCIPMGDEDVVEACTVLGDLWV